MMLLVRVLSIKLRIQDKIMSLHLSHAWIWVESDDGLIIVPSTNQNLFFAFSAIFMALFQVEQFSLVKGFETRFGRMKEIWG